MKFLRCVIYSALIGISSLLIGMILPREWFHPDHFLYRPRRWEKNGGIYQKLRIRKWKDKLPDFSHVAAGLYPKKAQLRPNEDNLLRLIAESCVAEFTHLVLILLSLAMLSIWPGPGGWVCWLLSVLGNLPFILIQRFNRPRLITALNNLSRSSC